VLTVDLKGTIPREEIGVFYAPTTTESSKNGELTFGGVDSTKYTGSITYTSLTTTSPADEYWEINESITYGSTTILSTTAGIVDTGELLFEGRVLILPLINRSRHHPYSPRFECI
jgi:Eukaryotic aspartyl protease